MLISPHAFARQLEQLGLTVHEDAVTALAILDAAQEAAEARPTDDLVRALESGKLTKRNVGAAVEIAATKLAAKQYAQQVVRDIDGPLRLRFNAAIRSQSGAILDALRPRFDEAAAVVHAAAKHFTPGATDREILSAGAASALAHEQLGDACAELARIRHVRVTLADLGAEGEQDASWWIASATDEADLDRARWAFRQPADAFHSLASAGFQLRMNTPQEAAVVTSAAARATAKAEAAERDRLAAEVREGWPAFGAA